MFKGYYAMTRSLQLIPPTTVAVLRALEIILAYVAQVNNSEQSTKIYNYQLVWRYVVFSSFFILPAYSFLISLLNNNKILFAKINFLNFI